MSSWLPAITSLSLGACIQVGVGGDSFVRVHEVILLVSALVAMCLAPVLWFLLLATRVFRLTAAAHGQQVLADLLGWLSHLCALALLESQPFPGWFLD